MKFTCLLIAVGLVGCGYNNAYKDIHDLQAAQDDTAARLAALEMEQMRLESEFQLAEARFQEFGGDVEELELQLQLTMVQLAALSGETRVVGLLDPCGDATGQFDEVLLKLSDGRVMAYFEDGGKRFLSVLSVGTLYETTDSQRCRFKVSGTGALLY